ncbi:MAG: FliI/YscN family ATPase [Polyangiaceae bacterium]
MDFAKLKASLREVSPVGARGRVLSVTGVCLRATMPGVRLGDVLSVSRVRLGSGSPLVTPLLAEVVGFHGGEVVAMPLGTMEGVGPDDEVESTGYPLRVRVGPELLGRVVDGLGRPIDGRELTFAAPLYANVGAEPPPPLSRRPVDRIFRTGVRVIDGLCTLGEGQRVGLFAGSGVGKSTLLGAIARHAAADVVVVALVGERGREVGEFIEHSLGEEGLKRSIVVVATSDVSPLERLRSAEVATAYAEHFRDQGARVLLLLDSITRYARASREVGLAVGEPPARRGYPPSTFALLPRLLERAGQSARGSMTALYTVLIEGGDMEEPIADEVRGILDGHIVLDRAVAERGRYPAVNVPASLSRVMSRIVTPEHDRAAKKVRALISVREAKRDLVALGAYAKGADLILDEALAKEERIERFLAQSPDLAETESATLEALARAVG